MIRATLPRFVVHLRDGQQLSIEAEAMCPERTIVRFLDEACEDVAVIPMSEVVRAYREGAVEEETR